MGWMIFLSYKKVECYDPNKRVDVMISLKVGDPIQMMNVMILLKGYMLWSSKKFECGDLIKGWIVLTEEDRCDDPEDYGCEDLYQKNGCDEPIKKEWWSC